MESTTVKLDGPLIQELKTVRRGDQTLTSLVREMLQTELHRRHMVSASEKYLAFVRENPDEALEMDEWAAAPLSVTPPGKRRDSGRGTGRRK